MEPKRLGHSRERNERIFLLSSGLLSSLHLTCGIAAPDLTILMGSFCFKVKRVTLTENDFLDVLHEFSFDYSGGLPIMGLRQSSCSSYPLG